VRKDFPRRLAAVKFAEQSAYGLDDERIRVTCKDATPIPHLRHQPEFREATGKEIRIHALLGTKDRTCPGFLHQTSEAILPVCYSREFSRELHLFFREVHAAETVSINVWRGL